MTGEQLSPDLLIQGLKTTSDKIRVLAKAGYPRAEIAKLLNIRYQHVRKVLLDSGITDGLRGQRTGTRAPTPIDRSQSPTILPAQLLQAGFYAVGEWKQTDTGAIVLEGRAPVEPGVYAFVVDGRVVYIGLTLRSLRGRMDQYRRGDPRQRTSARVNGRIRAELASERTVKVIAATPKSSDWNGLPVNLAAGLEVALIQAIRPIWNIQVGAVALPADVNDNG